MTDITCDNLPPVRHAELTTRTPTNGSYRINALVTFTCHSGYWFSPGNFSLSIICESTGLWSAITASCIGK